LGSAISAPERTAPRDRRTEKTTARKSAEQEKDRPGDDGDDGESPRVASQECGRHTEHAETDGRLAATAAFGARAATAFPPNDDVIRRPRIEQQPEANCREKAAENERNEFETHESWGRVRCRDLRRQDSDLGPRVRALVDLFQSLDARVRVDLRRGDRRVAEKLLHRSQVRTRVEEMRRERVPQ
jgi:hypothetical protein